MFHVPLLFVPLFTCVALLFAVVFDLLSCFAATCCVVSCSLCLPAGVPLCYCDVHLALILVSVLMHPCAILATDLFGCLSWKLSSAVAPSSGVPAQASSSHAQQASAMCVCMGVFGPPCSSSSSCCLHLFVLFVSGLIFMFS